MKLLLLIFIAFTFSFSATFQTTTLSCQNGQVPDLSTRQLASKGTNYKNDILTQYGGECGNTYYTYNDRYNLAYEIIIGNEYKAGGTSYCSNNNYSYSCIDAPPVEEITCEDGGTSLNGSCERECEEVNLTTMLDYNDVKFVTVGDGQQSKIMYGTKCVASSDCAVLTMECVATCGSQDNILTNTCDSTTGLLACECKTPFEKDKIFEEVAVTEPPRQDEIPTDETIVTNDTKSLKNDINNLNTTVKNLDANTQKANEAINDNLQDIKNLADNNLKVNQTMSNNINTLNQKLNEHNDILANMNNTLTSNGGSNDTLLNGVNDTLVNMNNNMGDKLLNIYGSIDGVRDGITTLNEKADGIQNSLDTLTDKDEVMKDVIDSIITNKANEDNQVVQDINTQISDLNNSADSVIDTLQGKLNDVASGFTFTPPSGGGSTVITFNAFGSSKSVDLAEFISPMSGIISTVVALMLMILSIKIYFFGFLLMKKD